MGKCFSLVCCPQTPHHKVLGPCSHALWSPRVFGPKIFGRTIRKSVLRPSKGEMKVSFVGGGGFAGKQGLGPGGELQGQAPPWGPWAQHPCCKGGGSIIASLVRTPEAWVVKDLVKIAPSWPRRTRTHLTDLCPEFLWTHTRPGSEACLFVHTGPSTVLAAQTTDTDVRKALPQGGAHLQFK